MSLNLSNGTYIIQGRDFVLISRADVVENPMGQQEKQRQPSFVRIVVVGLLLLPMNLLLRLVGRFMRTLSLNTNSQRSPSESSMDSFSMPSSSTIQRSGLNQPTLPIQDLLGKDSIGLSLMRPPLFLEQFGSNISGLPFQIGEDGLYWSLHLGDTTGFMISTQEASLVITPNGIHGNTPLQVRGISAIT